MHSTTALIRMSCSPVTTSMLSDRRPHTTWVVLCFDALSGLEIEVIGAFKLLLLCFVLLNYLWVKTLNHLVSNLCGLWLCFSAAFLHATYFKIHVFFLMKTTTTASWSPVHFKCLSFLLCQPHLGWFPIANKEDWLSSLRAFVDSFIKAAIDL